MNIAQRIVNFIVPKEEKRDIIHGNVNLGALISNTKGEVTEEEAMNIPAVKASVELISSSVANLPIKLYKKDEFGEIREVEDDRRVFLLNKEPNRLTNGFTFKHNMAKDLLFYGNHYVHKTMVGNNVEALHGLPTADIQVQKYVKRGYVYYADIFLENSEASSEKVRFQPEELIIFLKSSQDGVTGKGVLEENSDILKLALNEMEYSKNILENGALPLGTLQTATSLSDAAIERLKRSFEATYQGAKNVGRTLILEDGLEYKSISLKPNELDLTNSKRSTMSDIARVFNVPESMINSESNKYSSNEQNNIHFLQYCLAPLLTSMEMSLNKSLLLEKEKLGGYFFGFDTSNVLQTTQKEKVDATVAAYRGNVMTINEARRELKLPDITDNDFYKLGLGDVLVDKETGIMTIPNLGRQVDPENLKKEISAGELLALEKKIKDIKDIKEFYALKGENEGLIKSEEDDNHEKETQSEDN